MIGGLLRRVIRVARAQNSWKTFGAYLAVHPSAVVDGSATVNILNPHRSFLTNCDKTGSAAFMDIEPGRGGLFKSFSNRCIKNLTNANIVNAGTQHFSW